MSSYGNYLMSWMGDVQSKYGGCTPKSSGHFYSMLNSSDSPQPFKSFQYKSDKSYPGADRNDASNDWKLYAMALQVYSELLRNYYQEYGPSDGEEHIYHWRPVNTPYGTTIIDVNSGKRVYLKRSSHGKEIIGATKDMEYNFGRGMASEAVKMDYDNRLYEDARPEKRRQ